MYTRLPVHKLIWKTQCTISAHGPVQSVYYALVITVHWSLHCVKWNFHGSALYTALVTLHWSFPGSALCTSAVIRGSCCSPHSNARQLPHCTAAALVQYLCQALQRCSNPSVWYIGQFYHYMRQTAESRFTATTKKIHNTHTVAGHCNSYLWVFEITGLSYPPNYHIHIFVALARAMEPTFVAQIIQLSQTELAQFATKVRKLRQNQFNNTKVWISHMWRHSPQVSSSNFMCIFFLN